jgi:hypothetical protein
MNQNQFTHQTTLPTMFLYIRTDMDVCLFRYHQTNNRKASVWIWYNIVEEEIL